MGQEHNELRRGPLSAAVSAALGDTRGGGVERYGETMTPVMDAWSLPEWAFLRGERLGVGFDLVAAVALQNSNLGLRNPANSEFLVVPEYVQVHATGATIIALQLGQLETVDVTTTPCAADTRWLRGTAPSNGHCVARFGSRNFAGNSGDQLIFEVTLDAQFQATVDLRRLGIVLAPSYELWVSAITVNLQLDAGWAWRERRAFGGELG